MDVIITVASHDEALRFLNGARVLFRGPVIDVLKVRKALDDLVCALVVFGSQEVVVVGVGVYLAVVVRCLQELREHRSHRLNR